MGIKSCTNNGNSYSVEFEDGSSVEVIKKYDYSEDSTEWWWEAVGATSSQKEAISNCLGETVY